MSEQTADKSTVPAWAWKWIAAAVALSAAGVMVTWSAWVDIVQIAVKDEEASHIWLVPILVGWLVGVRIDRLAGYRPRLDPLGPVMMLAGWAVSFYGFYNQVQSLWHGGALLLVVGCLVTVLGAGLLRLMPAAFAALLFLIPVPGMIRQQIAIPLQTATAAIAQFCFDLFAVPVTRSGNLLSYNGVDVTVAEACNGMRMVFTLLSVCYVFAFGTNLRAWVRVLVLVLSPLVAVACNVIRVIPTIWVYGHYSPEIAETFHNLSGWVMIFVSFLMLIGFVRLLEWMQLPVRPGAVRAMPRVERAAWIPARPWVAVALAAVALAAATVEGAMRPTPADAAAYHARVRQAAADAPTEFGPWVGRDIEVPRAAVEMLQPNAIISRTFEHRQTGETVSVLIVHCRDARDMTGHFPPNCYPGVGWVLEAAEPSQWTVGDRATPGMTYRFTRGVAVQQRQMVIVNLLVMPNGRFLRSMKGVYQTAADYTTRFFGAAQVQVVMSDRIDPLRRQRIALDMLEAHRPVIDAIISAPIPSRPDE